MNKIVYNACFGGFGLSDEAYELYAKLAGIKVYPEESRWGGSVWYTEPPMRDEKASYERNTLHYADIARHDSILVKVVEELGDKANARYSKLRIYETDSDRYIIEEYDGNESVVVSYDNSWIIIK